MSTLTTSGLEPTASCSPWKTLEDHRMRPLQDSPQHPLACAIDTSATLASARAFFNPASRQNTSTPQGLNWPISNWKTQKNEWFKGLSIQTLYTPAVVVAKSDLCNSSGWGSLSSTWEAPICPHPMKPPTSVNLRAVPNQGSIFPCWVNTRPERCLAKCG